MSSLWKWTMNNIYLTIVFSVGQEMLYQKHQYGSMMTSKGQSAHSERLFKIEYEHKFSPVCQLGNLHTLLHCCTRTFSLENTQTIMSGPDSPQCTSRPYDPSPSLGKSIDVQLVIFIIHVIIILNGSKHDLRSSENWKHACGSWFWYAFLRKGKITSEHCIDHIQWAPNSKTVVIWEKDINLH